jgi:hypothetical protein
MTDNVAISVDNTQAVVPEVPVAQEKPAVKGKRGRPALISDKAFSEVWNKSKSLSDVIQAFAILRSRPVKEAKLYASMRAAAMRDKDFDMKLFPRGRPKGSTNAVKKASKKEAAEVASIVAETLEASKDAPKVDAREEAKKLLQASMDEGMEALAKSVRSGPMPDPNAEFIDTEDGRANDGMCDWADDE